MRNDNERDIAIELVDYWTPIMIRSLVDANVMAAFGREPRHFAEVAAEAGIDGETLRRVLRALAGRGVFEESENGQYQLSRMGQYFLADHPGTVAGSAIWHPWDLHAWAEFNATLREGGAAFPKYFGRSLFEYLASHPDAGEKYDISMQRRTSALLRVALPAWNWPSNGTIVDIGGGTGLLLSEVLKQNPELKGVLFDRRDVVDRAPEVLASAGVSPRVKIMAGDFLKDAIPPNCELYVLASVLHDWNDEGARNLLRRCTDAMGPHSRLLIFESVLSSRNIPDIFKSLDLHMLVLVGGRERSETEWRELLDSSGLSLVNIKPTPGPCWIEAVRSENEGRR
jgi:hypothetical protein